MAPDALHAVARAVRRAQVFRGELVGDAEGHRQLVGAGLQQRRLVGAGDGAEVDALLHGLRQHLLGLPLQMQLLRQQGDAKGSEGRAAGVSSVSKL